MEVSGEGVGGNTLLFNMHKISAVRQIEIHAAGLLVSDPCLFEAEITIAMLENCRLPGRIED
jgi:hypothetical protein